MKITKAQLKSVIKEVIEESFIKEASSSSIDFDIYETETDRDSTDYEGTITLGDYTLTLEYNDRGDLPTPEEIKPFILALGLNEPEDADEDDYFGEWLPSLNGAINSAATITDEGDGTERKKGSIPVASTPVK